MASVCPPPPGRINAPPPAIPTVPPHFAQQPVPPQNVCIPVVPPAIATVQVPTRPPQKQIIQQNICPPVCPDFSQVPPATIPVVPPCYQPVQVPPKNVCVPVVPPAVPVMVDPGIPKVCRYIQPARPKSYAPVRQYQKPCSALADATTYNRSYMPVERELQKKFVPIVNLCVGEGKFATDTVHTLSYQPVDKHMRPCLITPCNHKLLGEGPMQEVTTQKHDYVPKYVGKSKPFKHPVNLVSSDCPLEETTVNKMSYQPVDRPERARPFYPRHEFEMPKGRFTGKTVHSMSYQPVEISTPEDLPWARKNRYQPPELKMEGNTVQSMSFQPPGMFVECAPNDPQAIPCPPGTVMPSVPFIPHYPGNQAPGTTAGVCCPCPKAAC